MHEPRRLLTYSNVVSTLALVVAFGGGTAYAAARIGSVCPQRSDRPSGPCSHTECAGIPPPAGIQSRSFVRRQDHRPRIHAATADEQL